MAAGIPFSATYRDARGFTSTVKFFYNDASTDAFAVAVAKVQADVDALTNAGFQGGTQAFALPVVYGATAQFQDIEDKAVFTFQTTTGAIHRYRVPAPKSTIFLADLETVNPANTAVATFVADMLVEVASRDGEPLAHYISGIRIRAKKRRKINVFTSTPSETGPDE